MFQSDMEMSSKRAEQLSWPLYLRWMLRSSSGVLRRFQEMSSPVLSSLSGFIWRLAASSRNTQEGRGSLLSATIVPNLRPSRGTPLHVYFMANCRFTITSTTTAAAQEGTNTTHPRRMIWFWQDPLLRFSEIQNRLFVEGDIFSRHPIYMPNSLDITRSRDFTCTEWEASLFCCAVMIVQEKLVTLLNHVLLKWII